MDDLEGEVERLRNQQEQLKRRLKTKADKKTRLEVRGGAYGLLWVPSKPHLIGNGGLSILMCAATQL